MSRCELERKVVLGCVDEAKAIFFFFAKFRRLRIMHLSHWCLEYLRSAGRFCGLGSDAMPTATFAAS